MTWFFDACAVVRDGLAIRGINGCVMGAVLHRGAFMISAFLSALWLAWRQACSGSRMPLDNVSELPAGWRRVTPHQYHHAHWDVDVTWGAFSRRWMWLDANGRLRKHLLRSAAMVCAVRHWSSGFPR